MIVGKGFTHKTFKFPCGESHVRIETIKEVPLSIDFAFKEVGEILDLMLIVNAIKHLGREVRELRIPYVPFGRQDRITVDGECFSLQVFAEIINNLGFKRVVITDPHSDVTPALINNVIVIKQKDVFLPFLKKKKGFWLVSPDAGALKKTVDLASHVKTIGVIECSKRRDVKDGSITGIKIESVDLEKSDAYIVDDICDGGRTFVEIAKILRGMNSGKIILLVTHGFFTKGLEVFDGLIDEIHTMHGRIK